MTKFHFQISFLPKLKSLILSTSLLAACFDVGVSTGCYRPFQGVPDDRLLVGTCEEENKCDLQNKEQRASQHCHNGQKCCHPTMGHLLTALHEAKEESNHEEKQLEVIVMSGCDQSSTTCHGGKKFFINYDSSMANSEPGFFAIGRNGRLSEHDQSGLTGGYAADAQYHAIPTHYITPFVDSVAKRNWSFTRTKTQTGSRGIMNPSGTLVHEGGLEAVDVELSWPKFTGFWGSTSNDARLDQLFQDLGMEDESQQQEVISQIKKAKLFFGEKVTLAGGSFAAAAIEDSSITNHFDYKVRKLLGMEKINRRESLVRKFRELDSR